MHFPFSFTLPRRENKKNERAAGMDPREERAAEKQQRKHYSKRSREKRIERRMVRRRKNKGEKGNDRGRRTARKKTDERENTKGTWANAGEALRGNAREDIDRKGGK
eukprot:TRINITY_DN17159_c0_g1_i1.p2 TRINITY_DN17159_c0_g1~~TRINITY_DN17159_c0_g1_i1.p2  ORF type:complete len:107 (+),score=35.33 TRINITY_DN17159_c0_g1_i1:156-476(+)